jgi:hypothetical protein
MNFHKLIYSRKNYLLFFLYIVYIIAVLKQFYTLLLFHYPKEGWAISEWLINYRGGFTRRGLAGEFLLRLYNAFGLNPYTLILSFCIAAYAILTIYFIRNFIRKGYSLFLLPFVFFLGNPLSNVFMVRKDVIMALFFIGIVYLAIKRSKFSVLGLNILMVLALLVHEAIAFFCIPILVLLLMSEGQRGIKSFSLSLLKLAPSIILFILLISIKVSTGDTSAIWHSWQKVPFPYQNAAAITPQSAVNALSTTLGDGLSYLKHTLTDSYNGVPAMLAWIIAISLCYIIIINSSHIYIAWVKTEKHNNFNTERISAILLFQLCSVIPLFIIGCDFGRWIFYWIVSSFVIYLMLPSKRFTDLFPAFFIKASAKLAAWVDLRFKGGTLLASVLPFLVGFPMLTSGPSWHMDMEDFYKVTAIVVIYKFIAALVL